MDKAKILTLLQPKARNLVIPLMSKLHGAPWTAILSLATAFAYDISPLGLINALIPIIGWIDNAIINGLLVGYAVFVLYKRKKMVPVQQVNNIPPRN